MSWKKVNLFGKKNKEEVKDSLEEREGRIDPFLEKDDEPIHEDEDFNPKDSDLKDRNKKLVLIMSIVFLALGIAVYYINKSRTANLPQPKKKESVFVEEKFENTLDEDTKIAELKKKVMELEKRNKEVNQVGNNEKVVNPQKKGSKVNKKGSNTIPNSFEDKNNNGVIADSGYQARSNFPGGNRLVFPTSPPKKDEKPPVIKVVVQDDPFNMKSFSPSIDWEKDKKKSVKYASLNQTVDVSYSHNNMNVSNKESKEVLPAEHSKKVSKDEVTNKEKDKDKVFTIPSGSFFRVVLLNGVDALTGMGGRSNAYPVIARVLTESILPNRFFADMKGCFVLGVATGELSNERVIFKMDTLSCVTRTGKVLEKKISGTIAGEDGKIGLIGRVVSKSGAHLGRILLAKFVESAGNIMSLQGQIVTAGGGGVTTQVKPSEALKMSVGSGLGGAAQSLAEYYLKLADQIFPVIEINAGREGDLMLLKPLVVNINNDLKDNGGFLQRAGGLVLDNNPENRVFRVEAK